MNKLSLLGSLALVLAIIGPAYRHAAFGDADLTGRSEGLIRSASLEDHGGAVAIQDVAGTQILDPGRGDTSFAGYEQPLVSDDHRAAAWLEDQGPPISDASYAEPTGAWLFAGRHLLRAVGCDSGEPFRIRFSDGGGSLVLECSFPHGPPQTHEISFDTRSGRCLSSLSVDTGTCRPCRGNQLH